MYDPEFCQLFFGYLNEGDKPWIELGLIDNAPESAVKAYEEYVKMETENIKQGKQENMDSKNT